MRLSLLTTDYLVVTLGMCQHWRLNSNVTTCTWHLKSPQQCWYGFKSSVMLHWITVSQCFQAVSVTFILKHQGGQGSLDFSTREDGGTTFIWNVRKHSVTLSRRTESWCPVSWCRSCVSFWPCSGTVGWSTVGTMMFTQYNSYELGSGATGGIQPVSCCEQ